MNNSVWMTSYIVFPQSSSSAHLDVLITTVLYMPRILLASYYGAEQSHVEIIEVCVPAGEYYVTFTSYVDSAAIGIGAVTFTERPCISLPFDLGMFTD